MQVLAQRVALVTGGGRGIGRAAAVELARRGAHVAVAARSRDEVEAVATELRKAGAQSAAFAVDLSDPAGATQLAADVVAQLGPIDILVNNAGMAGPYGTTWEVDPAAWTRAIMINLVAPFHLIHATVGSMIERGWGRIINVSSGAARMPIEGGGAYSASKAGLDLLSRQVALEAGSGAVAAISLYPGVVDTMMQTEIRSQPSQVVGATTSERFRDYYESGRLQQPERPGRLIAILAGEVGTRFHGEIVDIYSPEIQQLIDGETGAPTA